MLVYVGMVWHGVNFLCEFAYNHAVPQNGSHT